MNYSRFLLRAALLALLTLQSSFAVDFTLAVTGSKTVTRGYSTVFAVKPKVTAGKDEQAHVKITGLPEGATANWWYLKLACCKDYAWKIATEQPVQIAVPASAEPGTYPVTITYTSFSGVSRSVTFPLQVIPEPVLPAVSLPANVDFPDLALWKSNMSQYGTAHCSPAETQIGKEAYAWYYDGSRVYEQIAKILDDKKYLTCAQMFNNAYRQAIDQGKGVIAGWRYFPHGLAMNYERTGDQLSRAAVIRMADGSPWAQDTTANSSMVHADYAREIAYATSTVIMAERLGRARSWKLSFLADSLLSHFDQWYVQRTATPQPFVVALAAEALIDYYDLTHDVRVPGVLKMAADELWARSWDPVSKSFFYVEFFNNTQVPSNDTNLLIAPLYGWVFQHTGEAVYRERGDFIFASGVRTAWLDGGKQFSMNYRWSPKYIEWRQSGSAPAPDPAPAPASIAPVSGTPQTAAAGAAFASPLAVLVRDKDGKPLPRVSVTFTAPVVGASATFAGVPSTAVPTNANGIATTPVPVANAAAGSYQIAATVSGLPAVSFALTNQAAAATSVTAGSLTFPWNPKGQPVTLTATITGNAGPVNEGTVEFRVSGVPIATVAVVSGLASAAYTVPATVVPGTLPVEARFSGFGTYPAASGNGSITIVRRIPVITWPAPANISQGKPLSSTQLNAQADIAGTFRYSPAAGTVLPAAAGQTLSATFTPSDTVRYTGATATTKITVVPAAPAPGKPANLTPVSAVATREPGTRAVLVTVTFRNRGGASNGVVTFAMLAGKRAQELSPAVPVGEGETATAVLKFPATVPAGNASLFVFTNTSGASLNVVVP